MKSSWKKWATFVLRWGIAVAGIAWVVSNISLRDHVLILDKAAKRPVEVPLAVPADEDAKTFQLVGHDTPVPREELLTKPDRKSVTLKANHEKRKLLAIKPRDPIRPGEMPESILVENPDTKAGEWINPNSTTPTFHVQVPYPRVDIGLARMVGQANPLFLWGAVLVFPLTFLITGLRWHMLLKVVDINLGLFRTFVINMVGAFYSTFMPGSTGGDVLKAYYASKNTPFRTRAVMSVIVDRAIGLLALIIMGGAMAAYQALRPHGPNDPVAESCAQVALASGAILAAVAVGLTVFYTPFLRRITGLDFIIKRMPMQRQVQNAIDTMERYRRRPGVVFRTLFLTFPVHITVVLSAMFAGQAFNLPLPLAYYFVAVPVIVLVGAIPISPQGAGVMEVFAVKLTERQGCTVGQAFALTMSIRLVQMLWNLVGGIFVFRGGYHAPSAAEQRELERDVPDVPADAAVKV